ncbi:SusC/RagA family TonB-linked outer membrane protein [Chitinophaga ginsengisoli]|uniref:TonB-linked SusC/RagA family outer membrane protein n=1 Tax=Chitinophaga ginsengisoli TaxID=363837 RepID=A0A2P8GMQ8_9BACT|nr:SusC/RagA family TonB-linked outer membrane protein [Chitinophaga ginsengisoli]PSL35249.1 TonB-linked SusC/RagA family outer membrane protein [Chitinophaga ginsengisoli]
MRKSPIFFLSTTLLVGQVAAQNRAITGKITFADGGRVVGATVIVKGITAGTVTNENGEYIIQVPPGASTLVVKFIGMKDQEIKLGASTKQNVVLHPDVNKLNETVVTANAIRRNKISLGYAAPILMHDELLRGHSISLLNALAGKVPGANVTTGSNAPGSSSRIVLRGGSSIIGNNQALMVVDGVLIDNSGISSSDNNLAYTDFGSRGNDLDPEDVESITVLKGPTAAALYGSRASNGALMITTRKGGKDDGKENEVVLSSTLTLSNVAKLPDFQNQYGQGYLNQNGDGFNIDPKENLSWGRPFTGAEEEWGQSINGVRLKKAYSAQKDAVKKFFEPGKMVNTHLSLAGAGDKTTYYLSLNSLNANGVMPGDYDKYNKYGVRFNGSAELNNKICTSVNFNYNKINSIIVQGGQGRGSVYNILLQTPRDIPIDKMGDINNPYYSFGNLLNANGLPYYGYYGAYTRSPYFILRNYRNENDVDRITGAFTLEYKPLKGLTVFERVSIDIYSDRRVHKQPKYSFIPADDAGNYSQTRNIQTANGYYSKEQHDFAEVAHDLIITATKNFSPDFHTSLMIGNNVRQRGLNTTALRTNAAGLIVPGWYGFDNSNGPVTTNDALVKRRSIGIYGELNLAYKNVIYINANGRNDWSSTLPEVNNSFFYPGVNCSFVFSELFRGSDFNHVLTQGKLRVSCARAGNDADPYLLHTYYEATSINGGFGSTTFPFKGVNGYSPSGISGNANLKPEITIANEIGMELNFMDDRLLLDLSIYKNESRDQIIPAPLAPSMGTATQILNTGVIENRGLEISMRGMPVLTASGLSVELLGTYTRNKNTVLDVGVDNQIVIGGFSGMSIVAAKGKSYGEFYAQDILRDNQGRVIVDLSTGLPLRTSAAVYLGSFNPRYQASWGLNAAYKGWNFSILFDAKQGNKFFSYTKDITDLTGVSEVTAGQSRLGAVWPNSVANDGAGRLVSNTTPYFPEQYWTNKPDGQNVLDASYIRLREARLTYRIPGVRNRSQFRELAVGLFGNNLALWARNKYTDPEVNSGGTSNEQGLDFIALPSLKNFGFNMRVTF